MRTEWVNTCEVLGTDLLSILCVCYNHWGLSFTRGTLLPYFLMTASQHLLWFLFPSAYLLDAGVPVGLNLLWGARGCFLSWLDGVSLQMTSSSVPEPRPLPRASDPFGHDVINIRAWLPHSTSNLTCTKLNSWFTSPLPTCPSQEMVPSHQASRDSEIYPWLLPTFPLSHSVTKLCSFYNLSVSSISLLFIPVFGENGLVFGCRITSFLFYSVLFYSIPFCSIPSHFTRHYPTPSHPMPSHSIQLALFGNYWPRACYWAKPCALWWSLMAALLLSWCVVLASESASSWHLLCAMAFVWVLGSHVPASMASTLPSDPSAWATAQAPL